MKPGDVFEVRHPFVLEKYYGIDADGHFETMSWRPGVRFEPIAPDDAAAFADGEGRQILTVVSLHKPGRYAERVFYTRQWVSPAGAHFGKAKLRNTTKAAFTRLTRGYRYPYRIEQKAAA